MDKRIITMEEIKLAISFTVGVVATLLASWVVIGPLGRACVKVLGGV
jgi:hypothetical protein